MTARETNIGMLDVQGVYEEVPLTTERVYEEVPLTIEQVRIIHECPYPDYAGETTVTPATAAQTLETHDTVLHSDVTVEAIPYFTTTNASGGYTAVIGG